MSATAQRWWVRLAARWLARFNVIDGLVNMISLIITALSTALFAMQSYGYGHYAPHAIAVAAVGGTVFTYLYSEGGVYNHQQRDYQDMSRNFTEPRDRMNKIGGALATFYALNQRPPTDKEREEIQEIVDEWWLEYRDGMDVQNGDVTQSDLLDMQDED